jgi:hypothetical protein
MTREFQPLVSQPVLPGPVGQGAAPPPSRWRVWVGKAIYYLPDSLGGIVGGAVLGASGLEVAAKVAVSVVGFGFGSALGISLDLDDQRKRLGEAFQDRKRRHIAITTVKHLLVSGVCAAILGAGLHFG